MNPELIERFGPPSGVDIDQLDVILSVFDGGIQELILEYAPWIEEIVTDLAKPLGFRLSNDQYVAFDREITESDIRQIQTRCGRIGPDDRAGFNGTLHRVSCIRGTYNQLTGFTTRVSRLFGGLARPLLPYMNGSYVVIAGPGRGKTTLLRDMVSLESQRLHAALVIVDTSNEIAGDGLIPHRYIGNARRMSIPLNEGKPEIMMKALRNHNPRKIVVDEVDDDRDVQTLLTIRRRGVHLVSTAHGFDLVEALDNPQFRGLMGELDITSRQRRSRPCFDAAIEIHGRGDFLVHPNLAASIDAVMTNQPALTHRITVQSK